MLFRGIFPYAKELPLCPHFFNAKLLMRGSFKAKLCVQKSTMSGNCYEILGLTRQATLEEIKNKYYELAKKYHPDTDLGEEQKFKEIYNAYQILGNDQKRKQYDQVLNHPSNKFKEEFEKNADKQYDPSKMSEDAQKAFYTYSQPEWARTRRAARPRSKTSAQEHKQDWERVREAFKKVEEESQLKQKERERQKQKEERRQILEKLQRKWYGGFLQGLYARLIRRGQYDKDLDESEKEGKKQDKKNDENKDKK